MPVDRADLLGEEVDLAQARIDGLPLITRQLERLKPRAAALAEQVTRGRASGEVAHEHRRDLVLHSGALAHQLRAPRGQPPQTPGPLVLDPHGRQHAGLEQLRERPRVEPVALDLCVADRSHLHRVRERDLGHMPVEDSCDRERVAR